MKKEFIVERQGRAFVLYAGLLDLAHQQGLKSIRTELVQVPTEANHRVAICVATVVLEKDGQERTFTGIGDAAPVNVAPAMQTCLIRMAETRSKARALRDAVNVGVAAFEELGEEDAHDGAPERGYEMRSTRGRVERSHAPIRMSSGGAPATPARREPPSASVAHSTVVESSEAPSGSITEQQTKAIRSLCRPRNIDADDLARESFQVADLAALTEVQARDIIRKLNEKGAPRPTAAAA